MIKLAEIEVNYQPVAPDPGRSCKNCKHFKPGSENGNAGECFGHEVHATGTCNFFTPKGDKMPAEMAVK